jgi:hypothetical protein
MQAGGARQQQEMQQTLTFASLTAATCNRALCTVDVASLLPEQARTHTPS